jgi:non-ribosomal peptide synthetase component F
VTLGAGLAGEVNRLVQQTGTTLYMVLLAAFNTLLFRYTGQEDILVGSPIAGRYHADLENIIGLVIGGIVMRNFPGPHKTFGEFLSEVKTNTLEAYEHQAYPLEELMKKINREEKPGRDHVIEVALIVQNIFTGSEATAPGDRSRTPLLPGEGIDTHVPATSKLDMTIYVFEQEQPGDIVFTFEYSTALFKPGTIERMAGHLVSLLRGVAGDADLTLAEIDMVSDEEKKRMIGSAPPLYPLTHPQKRIYYGEKAFPGIGYNTFLFTVRYNEILEREILERAINLVIRKNEALRLRIVEFGFQRDPMQYIAPYTPYSLEEKTLQWLEQDFLQPPQMINSPLYYFAYIRFNEKESGFYMKLHHLITDGRSFILMFNEITDVYQALKSGKAVDEGLNPSYLEYFPYEKEYLRSPRAEGDRAFWHRYLLPLPGKVQLTKHAGDALRRDPAIHGKILAFPGEVRTKLHRYRKDRKISIFKLVLSALSIYISRVTGRDDVVIAAANHNRCEEDHWNIVGTFVSTFPLRIRTGRNLVFQDFVEKNNKEVNYILKNHQGYPFDLLLEELRQMTGVDPIYLLDVTLLGHPDTGEARYTYERHFPSHDPSPLTIHINLSNRDIHGVLELQWHYRTQVFSGEDIEQIHRCLITILDEALTYPEKRLSEIGLLSREEKEVILHHFNDTRVKEQYPGNKLVHQLFEEQAAGTPGHTAVIGAAQQQITYGELNKKAGGLAYVLKEKGVLADDIVAIMVEPSIGMVIGILGILKAGAAYLPIDPGYPQERIDYMLKDSNAKVIQMTETR